MKTVAVSLRSTMDKKGRARLESSSIEVRRVIAEYEDGTVKDHVGEVWKVVKNTKGRADLKTVR